MVEVRFINDTTPIEVTSDEQETQIGVVSETQATEIQVGGLAHADLSGRDLPDQHPISAITGLQDALDTIPTDYVSDAELEAALLEKQDVIRDLSEIRQGAELGTTAVQPSALESYATLDYVDNGLSDKQNTLTAGANIQIIGDTISATDTTYTAGTGISIVGNVISNTQTSAEWGNITGDLSDQTDLQNALNAKANTADLATVATSGSYDDLTDKPTIGNATLTIQKNSTNVDTFTSNATVDKIINITVPTTAAEVNALSDSTKYGASIDLSLDTTNYKLTLTLKDQDGNVLKSVTVDFPIESVVVNGSYDSINQKIVLTLQNGNTIDIPVGDLIAGLQTEITSTNKLDADLVDDSTSTSKFVTSNEKNTWNSKQDTISDLAAIRSGASAGATAVQPSDLATVATSGSYNDLSNKPTIPAAQVNSDWNATSGVARILNKPTIPTVPTNVSAFTNDAGYITNSALTGYATQTWVGQQGFITGITSSDVTTALGYTPYNSSNPSGYITSAALTPYALSANLATVATSGSYSDLSNTPTIPTVNNATITFTQGGTTKGTITLNQSNDETIELDAGSTITVDSALSMTSENPVQNKVITSTLSELSASINIDSYLDMIIAGNTSDLPIIAQSTYSDDLDDIIGGTYDNNV